MVAFLNTVPLFVLSILANLSSVCIVTFSYRIFPYRIIPKDFQLCPIPPALVSVFPSFIQPYLRCTPPRRVCVFWFLLAHHDALDL